MESFFSGDNKIITIIVLSAFLLLIMALILILFFYLSRKKIIQKELEKKSMELAHQQHILQASISAQEEERKRIAQDLHDAISAKLNVVSLTTHVLLDDPEIRSEQKKALQHILNVTTNTLESSRKIAHDLMPAILEKFGLKAALLELFEDFTQNTSLQIDHEIKKLPHLTKTNELHIFRILQELINNSIRHGNANLLTINVNEDEEGFTINYYDNGSGFLINTIKRSTGIGLQNIKSRTAILNGTLQIKSAPDQGSTFIIHFSNHG